MPSSCPRRSCAPRSRSDCTGSTCTSCSSASCGSTSPSTWSDRDLTLMRSWHGYIASPRSRHWRGTHGNPGNRLDMIFSLDTYSEFPYCRLFPQGGVAHMCDEETYSPLRMCDEKKAFAAHVWPKLFCQHGQHDQGVLFLLCSRSFQRAPPLIKKCSKGVCPFCKASLKGTALQNVPSLRDSYPFC